MLGATLIYALTFSLAKMVMPQYVSPSSFILLRVLAGVIFFSILNFWIASVKFSRKDWVILVFCGIFGAGINQLTYFWGLELTTPISGAIIMPTTPIVTYLISISFIKEKFSLIKSLGIIMGFLGVVVLILLEKKKFITRQILL